MRVALEAEQSVLGALLIEPRCLALVRPILPDPRFFMRIDHQEIFRAVLDLADEGEVLDLVTIIGRLEERKSLSGDSGIGYLENLLRETPTAANAAAYAEIVYREHYRRIMSKTVAAALDELSTGNPAEVISNLQLQLDTSPIDIKRSATSIDVVQAGFSALERSKDGRHLLPTGLEPLDRFIGGFEAQRLYVVGARPGSGKSALLLSVLQHLADVGHAVGFCSLEMPLTELAMRLFANRYGMNLSRLIRGHRNVAQELDDRYQKNPMSGLKIHFDDASTHLEEIVARAAEWRHRHEISVLFVDYLGLIQTDGNEPRHIKLGHVSRTLKQLAKRLDIAVVAACQLNREVTKDDRQPLLSDLRDSGSIEQDADCVIALHPKSKSDNDGNTIIEFGVLKNRSGMTDWIDDCVTFEGKTQRFIAGCSGRRSA